MAPESDALRSSFRSVHSLSRWPVPSTDFNAITSSFGPRIKLSSQKYDWHRGIDINAPEGVRVVAAVAGNLEAVTTFPDGGETVILRHAFDSPVLYKDKLLTHYFTFYMHLSEIAPRLRQADEEGLKPKVAAGARVGRVGHTGSSVVDDHLHFELRAGTRFSLEHQLNNPSSPGSEFGFDPHVHPMWLFAPLSPDMNLVLDTKPSSEVDGIAHFDSNDEQPLLNRVEFNIILKKSKRTVASHVLDFNERIGFDASTTASLDQPDTSKPYIDPILFGQATRFKTDIVLPAAFVKRRSGVRYRSKLVARDIWNEVVSQTW